MKLKVINKSYKKIMFAVIFLFAAVFMLGVNSQKVYAKTQVEEGFFLPTGEKLEGGPVYTIEASSTSFSIRDDITDQIVFEGEGTSLGFNNAQYDLLDGEGWRRAGLENGKLVNKIDLDFIGYVKGFNFLDHHNEHLSRTRHSMKLRYIDSQQEQPAPPAPPAPLVIEGIDSNYDVGDVMISLNEGIKIKFQKEVSDAASTLVFAADEWHDAESVWSLTSEPNPIVLNTADFLYLKGLDDAFYEVGKVELFIVESKIRFEKAFSTFSANVKYDIEDTWSALSEPNPLEFISVPEKDIRPAISGNEHYASNLDAPTPVQNFINQLRAYHDTDGDLTSQIYLVEDNYTPNNTVIGKHSVTVAVKDSFDNITDFIFYVHVEDVSSPTVSADFSTKIIGYDQIYDINAFINTLVISDNHYTNDQITVVVTQDTYTANKNVIGKYLIEITVTDPSNNETVVSFYINVKDTVLPVFNGTKELVKSHSNVMSINDVIAGIKATDAIDGDLTSSIVVESENYTGNGNVASKTPYEINLSVSDAAGNKAYHKILVTVVNYDGAYWYITNGVTLNLPSNTPMNRTQIIDLLSRADLISISPNSIVSYTIDTYSTSVGMPGIYNLAFNVKEPNGNSNDYTYAINVLGETNDDTDVLPDAVTFIDKVKTWLSDNKVPLIFGTVIVIGVITLVSKAKEQAKKNKRRRR